ncbi:glycoside hydrolase family 18 protein [Trichoderma chlorosporum]
MARPYRWMQIHCALLSICLTFLALFTFNIQFLKHEDQIVGVSSQLDIVPAFYNSNLKRADIDHTCNKVKYAHLLYIPPSSIPASGLTHVNFAFAYIDPGTYQISVMKSDMPSSLFSEVADLKTFNTGAGDVEIFVSIGGWSFSDNSTTTQPIFSDIAASETNRNKFANNLVNFLKEYGFDGVDFDWEYPGAPDRGGKKEDTENYVLLLKAVREAFDASYRSYGISFTAPSSYWYLQWFDLPGMIQYADWINLMTYDLHGVWDSADPIGSIVQAHTNLTEIRASLDLLWRVNIPPERVVMGLGFYGRSFTLSNTSCASPGCPFSGAAAPGTCSDSAGTLAYFEIMDILEKQSPHVIWDNTSAVKYFQYGAAKDQWVSYDDKETFAQKIKYANSVGLGGVMVWSVDQDDTHLNALRGLLGKDISGIAATSAKAATSATAAGSWASQNGQDCAETDCLSDSDIGSWGSDFAIAPNGGPFKDSCGSGKNKYIICPVDAMPSSCQWRGGESGKACHGQCHGGEVTLFQSNHATVKCLKPGKQTFCCQSNTWNTLVGSCAWSNDNTCPSGKIWVAERNTYDYVTQLADVDIIEIHEAYCCDSGFDACHWIGKGTCDQNQCADWEIELTTDPYGNTTSECAGGWNNRQKVLCCSPPQKLNPFLPVPLENIFPTLPPTTDIPNFHVASIQNSPPSPGFDTVTGAFGMVVIDGPPSVVTSLTTRDESHIQFLDCEPTEKRNAKSIYTARYICMNDSPQSNCDAVHEGGAKGTIVKLPEGCGFATYGVVKDVRLSKNLTVEHEMRKRAPSPNPAVYEMDISYDYSLVKRDSGTVYVRIDYGDSAGYWNDIVLGKAITKRSMNESFDKRFWSPDPKTWMEEFAPIRNNGPPAAYSLNLEQPNFSQLLYSQDKSAKCGGKDGFMFIELEGSVKNAFRFGVTLVGTIAPEINFEEAYGFFDVNMNLTGKLMLNGQASVNIVGSTKPESVFATDISNFGFSEPGIASFVPKMNIEASMTGQGQIFSDFNLEFKSGTDGYARTNAPLSIGELTGDLADQTGSQYWVGFAGGSPEPAALPEKDSVFKKTSDITLLGLSLVMRTWLDIEIFNMGTDVKADGAEFSVDVGHYFRVISNEGNISVIGGDNQVGVETYSTGISSEWEKDDTSHLVGSSRMPYIYTSGPSNAAPARTPPDWGTDSIISGDYFGCSSNGTKQLNCYASGNMSRFDPNWLIDPDDGKPIANEKRAKQDISSTTFLLLDPRATGNSREFTVKTPSGTNFTIVSHTYPNGQNGAYLVRVNPSAGYYNLANPNNCEDTSVTSFGDSSSSYVTEHIVELSTFSVMLEWMMNGTFVQPDGNVIKSSYTPVPEKYLVPGGFFQRPWNQWSSNPSATTPMDDIWTAFGDTTNPGVLVNCESVFNGVKMQIWRGNKPMADATWEANNFEDTSESTGYAAVEGGMSTIRLATSIFSYLNDQVVHDNMVTILNSMYATFLEFDERVGQATGDTIHSADMFSEFVYYALIPRLEAVQTWASGRIQKMLKKWQDVQAQPSTSTRASQVSLVIQALKKLLKKVDDAILIDTDGFDFEPPSPTKKRAQDKWLVTRERVDV